MKKKIFSLFLLAWMMMRFYNIQSLVDFINCHTPAIENFKIIAEESSVGEKWVLIYQK